METIVFGYGLMRCSQGIGNSQLFAYSSRGERRNFGVAWNAGLAAVSGIYHDSVFLTFSKDMTSLKREMLHKVAAFYPTLTSSSLALLPASFSASSRCVSSTNSMASFKFSR